jgi:hypothetical protein
MQNNKDAGQQDDDKLQLAMTAVEDAGERLRLSIVLDVSRHQLERYNITGAEAMGQEGSGRQRSGEVDRRRMLVLGRTGTCQRGTGCLWLTLILRSNYQPKDAGPAAKKPLGKMVKNTEILGSSEGHCLDSVQQINPVVTTKTSVMNSSSPQQQTFRPSVSECWSAMPCRRHIRSLQYL